MGGLSWSNIVFGQFLREELLKNTSPKRLKQFAPFKVEIYQGFKNLEVLEITPRKLSTSAERRHYERQNIAQEYTIEMTRNSFL